jgi:uncharacterized protein (DUF58 family)
VDWKATAATGKMQVKQFEPSIALEVVIFLNLNNKEYGSQFRIDSTELAIVIAASMANWVASQRQAIGFITNGVDSVTEGGLIQPIPPRKGRAHLIRLLETLARVQSLDGKPMVEVMNQQDPNLSWGTTIVLITGQIEAALFEELFQAKRRGQNVVLIIAGRASNIKETKQRAEHFGITFFAIQDENDLNAWRQ